MGEVIVLHQTVIAVKRFRIDSEEAFFAFLDELWVKSLVGGRKQTPHGDDVPAEERADALSPVTDR